MDGLKDESSVTVKLSYIVAGYRGNVVWCDGMSGSQHFGETTETL